MVSCTSKAARCGSGHVLTLDFQASGKRYLLSDLPALIWINAEAEEEGLSIRPRPRCPPCKERDRYTQAHHISGAGS